MSVRSPGSPLEWVVTVVVAALFFTVGFFLLGVFIVLGAIRIVVGLVVNWWRGRKRPRSRPAVIDVEYEIKD